MLHLLLKIQISFSCTLHNSVVHAPVSVHDLGVIIDKDLMFNTHINNIAHRAYYQAYAINKCFVSQTMPHCFCVISRRWRLNILHSMPVGAQVAAALGECWPIVYSARQVCLLHSATSYGCSDLNLMSNLYQSSDYSGPAKLANEQTKKRE